MKCATCCSICGQIYIVGLAVLLTAPYTRMLIFDAEVLAYNKACMSEFLDIVNSSIEIHDIFIIVHCSQACVRMLMLTLIMKRDTQHKQKFMKIWFDVPFQI